MARIILSFVFVYSVLNVFFSFVMAEGGDFSRVLNITDIDQLADNVQNPREQLYRFISYLNLMFQMVSLNGPQSSFLYVTPDLLRTERLARDNIRNELQYFLDRITTNDDQMARIYFKSFIGWLNKASINQPNLKLTDSFIYICNQVQPCLLIKTQRTES